MTDAAPDLRAPFPYFGGKSRCAADVWERNVGAQLFFRACGWHCIGAETRYAESDDMALRFVRRATARLETT